MAQKIFFQNASNGEPTYSAEDFSQVFGNLVSNGVFATRTGISFTTKLQGNALIVSSGSACLNGFIYTTDELTTLEIPDADATQWTRHGICLDLDTSTLEWNLHTDLLGQYDTKPTFAQATTEAPEGTERLVLATLDIPSATETQLYTLTDTTQDRSICGIVSWVCGEIDLWESYSAYVSDLYQYTDKLNDEITEIVNAANPTSLHIERLDITETEQTYTLPEGIYSNATSYEIYVNGALKQDTDLVTVTNDNGFFTITSDERAITEPNSVSVLIFYPSEA